MARKAIVLAVCCGAFVTASFACGAQTFGDIRAGKQTPNLTQPTEDPAIDKWMRRAPAGEAERIGADAGLSGDLSKSALMFDGNPIGGEIWLNHAATPGSASSAPAAVSSQVRRLINKQNKPAADKEDERKNLSRSPRSNDAATPQSASSSAPAVSSQIRKPINKQNKPAADKEDGTQKA